MTLTEVLTLAGLGVALAAQFGWLKWWIGQQEAAMKALQNDTVRNWTDIQSIHEQLQSLAVNEANVGGTLSNLALEIKQIRKDLDDRERTNGNLLQSKLKEQTADLTVKMLEMISEVKKEMRGH